MASSLRDIPGANRRTSTFRRRRSGVGARSGRVGPPILIDPRASLYDRRPTRGLGGGGSRRGPRRDRGRRVSPVDLVLAVAVVLVLGFLGWKLWSTTRVDVEVTGIEDDGAVTFEKSGALDINIAVAPSGRLENATLVLDGTDLADTVEMSKTALRWKAEKPLTAGKHHLVLTVPRPILPASHFTWDFMVDGAPPIIRVGKTLLDPIDIDDPVSVKGSIDDTAATLTANGDEVEVDQETGKFRVDYERAPAGPIRLVATDKAGQTTIQEVFVPIKRPMTRGVHMSAISWSTPELRDPVLDLIDRGVINTVELDIKDEDGVVGWDASLPLAKEIGAVHQFYDLGDAVKALKERGVYVVGRVVAFRDPVLAQAAWAKGDKDWVLQDSNGQPHGAYGGFTNFMNEGVRKYNIDLALEAVDLGVDEILWDYVRRPEGDLTTMRIPGLAANDSVEANVAAFLREAHAPIRAAGALQGASLFGIAADRPQTIGQSVPLIARAVDYIAPMTYPSLWVSGEYRVADPVHQPYEIVTRALEDFQKKAKGTGVSFVPWIQDYSLGATYDDDDVKAQIDAARGLGIDSWLLWSPRVRYHGGDLEKI
jgi:hypothetical protein